MLSRRQFLVLGSVGTTLGLATTPTEAAIHVRMERSIYLQNIHTGEVLKSVYWQDGKYQTSILHQLNHILRDHYSGETHIMDPRVIDLLAFFTEKDGAASFADCFRLPFSGYECHVSGVNRWSRRP